MIHVCCFQPLNLRQVVTAAVGDSYRLSADCVHLDHCSLGCRLTGWGVLGSVYLPVMPSLLTLHTDMEGHRKISLYLQATEPWLYLWEVNQLPIPQEGVRTTWSELLSKEKTHTKRKTQSMREKEAFCKDVSGVKPQARSHALYFAAHDHLTRSLSRQGDWGSYVTCLPGESLMASLMKIDTPSF